ncbi:MAG: hypothetical protein KKA28_17580 [Planctomycetes bacterium]|nr:hypothetical protein [Planctomycetota bacterium]MCG2685074.1 hypothetical protein [Planctomycetales bacterium]
MASAKDLYQALCGRAPRFPDEVAEQQVREWQQEAVKAIRDMFARMRRHLDGRSAATAGETGDPRQAQAIAKRLAKWKDQERQMVEAVQSEKLADEARKWLVRGFERGKVDRNEPTPKLPLRVEVLREIARTTADADLEKAIGAGVVKDALALGAAPRTSDGGEGASVKKKKSTEKGEAQAKIIAALMKHHEYQDGSCLKQEPIGVRELARLATVGKTSVTRFFTKQFKGRTNYRAACRDVENLVATLKLLNQEYSPYLLFGHTPPGEGDTDED